MKRLSKKEIKELIEQKKGKQDGVQKAPMPNPGKPTDKKTSQRIRKQGV